MGVAIRGRRWHLVGGGRRARLRDGADPGRRARRPRQPDEQPTLSGGLRPGRRAFCQQHGGRADQSADARAARRPGQRVRPRPGPTGAQPRRAGSARGGHGCWHRLPASLCRPQGRRPGAFAVLPQPPPADAGRPVQPGRLAVAHPCPCQCVRLDAGAEFCPGPQAAACHPLGPENRPGRPRPGSIQTPVAV